MSKDLRTMLLKKSILHIHKTGFTQLSINNACQMLNLSPASSRILENGPLDMVNHILDDSYKRSLQAIQENNGIRFIYKCD